MLASMHILVAVLAPVAVGSAIPIWHTRWASMTPHEKYSSSVGVLGCKINTNRIAYWPGPVSCNDICIKVSYADRSLKLLKVDSSDGAFDLSYDAWNFLAFGKSAKEEPHQAGGIGMVYELVPPEDCRHLLHDGLLPLSASNGMNYLTHCLSQPNSWVANNYDLINIVDPATCKYGWDESCFLDTAISGNPQCPHKLGSMQRSTERKVTNIEYGTGFEYGAW